MEEDKRMEPEEPKSGNTYRCPKCGLEMLVVVGPRIELSPPESLICCCNSVLQKVDTIRAANGRSHAANDAGPG